LALYKSQVLAAKGITFPGNRQASPTCARKFHHQSISENLPPVRKRVLPYIQPTPGSFPPPGGANPPYPEPKNISECRAEICERHVPSITHIPKSHTHTHLPSRQRSMLNQEQVTTFPPNRQCPPHLPRLIDGSPLLIDGSLQIRPQFVDGSPPIYPCPRGSSPPPPWGRSQCEEAESSVCPISVGGTPGSAMPCCILTEDHEPTISPQWQKLVPCWRAREYAENER